MKVPVGRIVLIKPRNCRCMPIEHYSSDKICKSPAITRHGVFKSLQGRRVLGSRIETCCCGTKMPPSVSVEAEGIRMWQAILECPACGFAARAVGYEPVSSLSQAACRWNARADHVQVPGFTISIQYH